jgi:hypothetical protein
MEEIEVQECIRIDNWDMKGDGNNFSIKGIGRIQLEQFRRTFDDTLVSKTCGLSLDLLKKLLKLFSRQIVDC